MDSLIFLSEHFKDIAEDEIGRNIPEWDRDQLVKHLQPHIEYENLQEILGDIVALQFKYREVFDASGLFLLHMYTFESNSDLYEKIISSLAENVYQNTKAYSVTRGIRNSIKGYLKQVTDNLERAKADEIYMIAQNAFGILSYGDLNIITMAATSQKSSVHLPTMIHNYKILENSLKRQSGRIKNQLRCQQ